MLLHETILRRAITQYCAENQLAITTGVLTEAHILEDLNQGISRFFQHEPLEEGLLDGIKGAFGQGSGLRNAADAAKQATTDAVNRVKQGAQGLADKAGQAVQTVKNDYTVGNAAGNLRKLAQRRGAAETAFQEKLDVFKEKLTQVQQERKALRLEQKQLLRKFHQTAHAEYVRAAQALGVKVTRSYAFYDEVDAAMEQRGLVPQVLSEAFELGF